MPKVQIPFVQKESPDNRYPINMYFLPQSFTGRDAMTGTPGLKRRVTPKVGPVRNMIVDKDEAYLYTVVGNTCYLIDKNWTATAASTTLDSSSGHVWMAVNLFQVMITDGASGYIVTRSGTTPTLTKISDTDFPVPSSLTMQDNYFIVTEKDTFNFWISAPSDGTSWTATDYTTCEGDPDNVTACISDHRQLFMLGPKSIEVFWNSEDAAFTFERFPDVFVENGICSPTSIAKLDNSLMYLDQDYLVRRLDGFVPKVISPPKMNQDIEKYAVKDDAIGYTYSRYGNVFYVLTFPTANATWQYNAATGLWNRWASEVAMNRHRSNCSERFNGKDVVGDYATGAIYTLEDDVCDDSGTPIRWQYTSPSYTANNSLLFHKELNIEFKTGVGLVTGQGSDPQVMLRYSDDNMRTWSSEHWRPMGKIGKYKDRVLWRRMGGSRNRVYEISGTDPVERTFAEANSDIEVNSG